MIRYLGTVLFFLATTVVHAEAVLNPAGPEVVANTETLDDQDRPAVAAHSDGSFVVIWQSFGQDGSYNAIVGQRFDADGARVGTEFMVNTYTTQSQRRPAVASHGDGRFVVVWRSAYQDGSSAGAFGQRFGADATPLGTEFRVNTYTTDEQRRPDVAAHTDGTFVVVWESYQQDAAYSTSIFGQRFAADGSPAGTEFPVNTHIVGRQSRSGIAMHPDGSFVVVWQSYLQDGSDNGVFAQGFAADGTRVSGEFQVNTTTLYSQRRPVATSQGDGDFVVAWRSYGQDGSDQGLFARRFNGPGQAAGTEFQVNAYTTGSQRRVDLAANPDGTFVAVWQADNLDGSSYELSARCFDSSGVGSTDDFSVNTYTTDSQHRARVAGTGNGSFVIVWESSPPRASFAACLVDADCLDPGERCVGSQCQFTPCTMDDECVAPAEACIEFQCQHRGQDGSHAGIVVRRWTSEASCGDANVDGRVTATDALIALRTAVGTAACALCVCDADGSSSIVATDALLLLQFAVGAPLSLTCPAC